MFTQALQIPNQVCNYAACGPYDAAGLKVWNAQPLISGSLLHNGINTIGAGDFFGVHNQLPVHYAVNTGYGVPAGFAGHNIAQTQSVLGNFGSLSNRNWLLNNSVYHGTYSANESLGGCFESMGNLINFIDNDTEVCFECALPGLSSKDIDICVLNGEIRVRVISGIHGSSRTSNSRTTSTTAVRTPLCCMPLPSFCDAAKCTAKVEQGRLLITCPRTAEYVKNITRVKVS